MHTLNRLYKSLFPESKERVEAGKKFAATISALILLVAANIFTSCNKEEEGGDNVVCPVDTTTQVVFDGTKKMTYQMFAEINANAKSTENFMVSPLSLTEVLMMLANGAEGSTKQQIMDAMQLKGLSTKAASESFRDINAYLTQSFKNTKVTLANSLWFDGDLQVSTDYISNNKMWFGADDYHQDLSTEKTMNNINNWCKDKTNGCIKQILEQPLSGDCRMALLNALYFKGKWASEFNPSLTHY